MSNKIQEIYQMLFDRFGPQHWWPGETPFEVMVGAVLTQNTNWTNVSRAIANLQQGDLLSFQALHAMPPSLLAEKIRPAGYYNLKAARLKNLLNLIAAEYQGRLSDFFAEETAVLRQKLLAVKGVGPETADSIVLYAAHKPAFVVDAYTYRILSRHSLIVEDAGYDEIQELFVGALPEDVRLYNEYHALLVKLGKDFCRKSKPLCASCPLDGL
ncbi:MAG: endonuclease [Deltaproteobacteria bacterium RIFOXYD12_FULL_57_12]|nr:MAG: endonuclease [Deltaproteobacteria bacterium RIFOXYD12_FULL_57_12]